MPFGGLVWVDRQPLHTLVYADQSLTCAGELSVEGRAKVDVALSEAGAESLDSAQSCSRPPLWSIAG
jgi:hypothetical protein